MFRMEVKLFEKIVQLINENPKTDEYFYDALNVVRNTLRENRDEGMRLAAILEKQQGDFIRNNICVGEAYKKIFDILVAKSPYSLDAYFLALEYDAPAQNQFWLPRRKKLMPVVKDLERLLITDELDELFLSMPPRVGKTTLAVWTITWLLGTKPDLANLYSSANSDKTGGFYKGVLEIINDPYTYNWQKIFKHTKYEKSSMCNAKETYIDTGRIKRYHSITCRSINSDGLNGSCDCNGLLIGDDLCANIEEALNPVRLVALWQKCNNDLLTRLKMGAKILWIGTRWSKKDPIGVRLNNLLESETQDKKRIGIINLPALDENDESNFNYVRDGFTTEFYKKRRESFMSNDDIASWLAQYQGEPVERSGLLFPMSSIKYYNGELPKGTPDRIYAPVDVAWGGGDFLSMPIFFQYGDNVYIHDWVFDNGDKYATRPKVVDIIIKYQIQAVEFEKNDGGDEYKEWVETELRKKHNYRLNITSRNTSTHQAKESRIFDKAPEIKEFYFLEPKKQSADYKKAMQQLCSYVILGKNKHDDAPDSLSKGCEMRRIAGLGSGVSYSVLKRPF